MFVFSNVIYVDHLQKSSITPNTILNTSNTIPDTVPEDYSDVVFPDQVTQNDNATHRYPVRNRRPPDGYRV